MSRTNVWKIASFLVLAVWLALAPGGSENHAQETTDQAVVRDFNTAAALQNKGLYDKAAVKWRAFIQQYPQDKRLDKAHYYLGVCQLHLKSFDEAVKTLQTVVQKYPQFESVDGALFNIAMARFQAASASNKSADHKAAAAVFAEVAAKFPASSHVPKSHYFRAESLFAAGDAAGSAEAYRQLATKFPDHPLAADAAYYLGVTLQDLKQFAEAAAAFEDFVKKPALAQHELAGEVRLRLGICLYEQKKIAEAESRFAEAAQKKDYPMADFALLRQGQCLLELGKKSDAGKLFASLLKTFPQSAYRAAAQLSAGKCFFEADKFPDAQQAFTAALAVKEANPDERAEASYWLGRTLIKLNKPDDALKVLEPASANATGEFAPYLAITRAEALYDLPARRKESGAAYQQFLQKHPQHALAPQAQYMTAMIALNAEDFAAAAGQSKAFLGNAAFAHHTLRPAVLFIAAESTLLGGGQTDAAKRQQAESLYRELVEKFPQHQRAARSLLRIGWCLLEGAKYEEAGKYLSGCLSAFTEPDQQAEARLMIGRAHARLNRHREALAEFDLAGKASPKWARGDEVLLEAVASLRQLDLHDEAQKRVQTLLTQFPNSPLRAQAVYQAGEVAQGKGQSDVAIARFSEVVQNFGDSPLKAPAQYGLAAAHFAKGDNAKALPPLDQLVAGSSDGKLRTQSQYLRGLVRQRLQQFEPATQDLLAFLATKPTGGEALDAQYALALCHVGAKKHAEAAAVLQALLTAKPDYPHADKVRYELGHALLNQNKGAAAAEAFASLAKAFPNSPLVGEAWFHVGRQHEDAAEAAKEKAAKAAQYAAAGKAFEAGFAAAKQPDLREKLRYKSGHMQFEQGQFAAAAETLQTQLKEFPQGSYAGPARFLAAESLYREGNHAAALPLFEKVAADKLEKYLSQSLYRAGECAANQKQWPASQKHYKALLTQFPKFEQATEARYGEAFALHSQNQFAPAVALYEQVTKESETETAAKARFMIGEIAFAQKKYDDAIAHFVEVTVGYAYENWQAMARYETARCFMERGQKEKAIASLEELLQKHPTHNRAKDGMKLLAELKK